MNVIVPDAHGDWFNQRDDSFSHFMRLDGKKAKEPAIFKNFSLGVATGRDAWCYNFSKNKLSHNIQRLIDNYEKARLKSLESENFVLTRNPTEISWNSNLEQRLKKNAKIKFENSALCKSFYRPFIPSNLYFHVDLVARRYQLASIFPNNSIENLTICSSGVGSKEYSCLMVDHIPCLDFLEKAQCFPRWLPGEQTKGAEDTLDFGEPSERLLSGGTAALPGCISGQADH